ncbi:MAG: 30S ribosomal protein S12 methylthiotransferase RimO [Firmicutes bacterium]|nr:30S ribosomal protein S12 methylthiotransferase RimO [Bacillota bacterium]
MALKIGLVSLGCPKNLVDSETMLGLLAKAGFSITAREEEADVLIVNTCSFIHDAKEESVRTLLELARHKAAGRLKALLAAGCLAQRYPEELAAEMPEVDGLIGTGDVAEIVRAVHRVLSGERVSPANAPGYPGAAAVPRLLATPRHTAYLKIAEGCDNRCSYCIIPEIRGPYRSRAAQDVLQEAADLAGRGARELILVAQDTTRYGTDLYGKPALAGLLEELARLEGVVWLRLMYAYPSLVNGGLIETIARNDKICRYLDMPLQHVSDSILKKMNRRSRQKDVVNLVRELRSAVPGIALRTSFIVGFPGETGDDFEELLDFIKTTRFDRVGVFAYSPEEGTPAALMPDQVSEEVKAERKERAMLLQQEISLERNAAKMGEEMTVLIEGRARGKDVYHGRGEGDAPEIDGKVFVRSDAGLKPGDFVRVRVTGFREYDLDGVAVSK